MPSDSRPSTPASWRSNRVALAVLALLLLFAWRVRVAHPGVFDFSADVGGRYQRSLEIVTGHGAPLVGRELSGLADRGSHGPTMFYVDALPFLFTRNPAALPAFLAALHVLGVWVVWRLGVELGGAAAGLIAAALTAGSSILSYWTRDPMNPSYLVLGTPLIHWALWRTVRDDRSRAVFAFVVATAFFSEFHLLVIAIGPVAVALWLLLRPRIAWKWLVAGVAVSTIFFVPLVIHGARTGDWDPILGWVDVLFRAKLGSGGAVWRNALSPLTLLYAPASHEALLPAPLDGPGAVLHHRAGLITAAWIALALAGLAVNGVVGLARARFRGHAVVATARADVFLVVALVLDALALASIRTEFYPRYVLTVLPIPFVAAGVGVERMAAWERGRTRALWRVAAVTVAVGLAVATNVQVGAVLRQLDTTGVMENQRPTYAAQLRVATALVRDFGLTGRADASRRLHSESGAVYGVPDLVEHLVRDTGAAPGTAMPRDWEVRMGREGDAHLAMTPGAGAGTGGAIRVAASPFVLIGDRPRVQSDRIRLLAKPSEGGPWTEPGFDDSVWKPWTEDFYGKAADETLAIRVPVVFDDADAEHGRRITIWSRACIDKAWLDGRLVRDTPCPRERRVEEVDRDRTDVVLDAAAVEPGEHLLALYAVIRDKWYDLSIFDAPLGPAEAR